MARVRALWHGAPDMSDSDIKSRIRFCIPSNQTPYVEIDGRKYRVGERPNGGNKLATVLGHQGKEFTERDFVLLLVLALEAKRQDVQGVELPCASIAGKRGWHADSRHVRAGVAKRFDGPVRTQKNRVIWEPVVRCEFDDETRCQQYLDDSDERIDESLDVARTLARLNARLDRLDELMAYYLPASRESGRNS